VTRKRGGVEGGALHDAKLLSIALQIRPADPPKRMATPALESPCAFGYHEAAC